MISTLKETRALADLISSHLPDAFVTLDADQVTPHLLDGTPCVFIPPPKLTETSVPAYVLRFQAQAWAATDKILTVLDQLDLIEDADPVQWDGAQSTSAPAYSVTITRLAQQ